MGDNVQNHDSKTEFTALTVISTICSKFKCRKVKKKKSVYGNGTPFLVQISQGQVKTVAEMMLSGFQCASYKVK